VTVHLVDDGIDTGPILAQATVLVRDRGYGGELARADPGVEHVLYPAAIKGLLTGRPRIVGETSPFREQSGFVIGLLAAAGPSYCTGAKIRACTSPRELEQ